jgi:hypothetical protein
LLHVEAGPGAEVDRLGEACHNGWLDRKKVVPEARSPSSARVPTGF